MSDSESLPVMVAIDGDADAGAFPAVVVRRWNGWAVPAFTLETVRAIAAHPMARLGDGSPVVRILGDGESPVVLEGSEDGDGEGGGVTWHPVARHGDAYLVGDGWVWLELEDDDDDVDDAPHVGHVLPFTGAWYCDTCRSAYCELA